MLNVRAEGSARLPFRSMHANRQIVAITTAEYFAIELNQLPLSVHNGEVI